MRSEIVPLPDLNTSVEVRGVTAGAKGRLMNSSRDEEGVLDYERYYAQLVIETAYDPETHEKLFAEGDYEALNALPAHVVSTLANKAEALSGAGPAYAVLEKNSGATESVATDSASQNG